jgi:antitoxin (DNA-binding transcriptional repressor) of toxin-antitoxin stability system
MTVTLSVSEQPIDLAQLLERARQGEEIVVLEAGKPVARFVLLNDAQTSRRRTPGSAKSHIFIRDDFDEPLPDTVMESFEV